MALSIPNVQLKPDQVAKYIGDGVISVYNTKRGIFYDVAYRLINDLGVWVREDAY